MVVLFGVVGVVGVVKGGGGVAWGGGKDEAEARYALNLADEWYDSYLEDEALEAGNSKELDDVLYADRF